MPPPKPTDAWDEILAALLPKSMRQWQDFQRKAVASSALTLVTLAFSLYTRQGFQVLAPLVGFFGMEAAKNIRHWIEWRREHPAAGRMHPELRRQLEQDTVRIMSDAVKSRAWVTWTVIACVTVPTLLELLVGLERAVALASVDPRAIQNGEWWRLLSGTYLHGSYYHFAGNMGAQERMEYTVVGDTVNLASRLGSAAEAGQIIVTEQIYRRPEIAERFVARAHRAIRLRGIQHPVTSYAIEDVMPAYKEGFERQIQQLWWQGRRRTA